MLVVNSFTTRIEEALDSTLSPIAIGVGTHGCLIFWAAENLLRDRSDLIARMSLPFPLGAGVSSCRHWHGGVGGRRRGSLFCHREQFSVTCDHQFFCCSHVGFLFRSTASPYLLFVLQMMIILDYHKRQCVIRSIRANG